MSDFLDRFGDQLSTAQERAKPSPQAGDLRSGRSILGRPRRLVLWVLAGSLGVAAPALAIIAPWQPSLERPGLDRPVAVSASPISKSVVEAFGVLRRGQSDADRERTASLVRAVGAGNQVDDVQTDGIRSVADGWALVPAKSMQAAPGRNANTDVLCLTDGQTIGCTPTTSAATNGLGVVSASATQTSIVGLVPDGVSAVRFTPAGGNAVKVTVASNFFSLSVPQTAPASTIKAPPGYTHGSKVPAPPMPVNGTLQWLDDSGVVTGPAQQAIGR